jgi:hypothetical protein
MNKAEGACWIKMTPSKILCKPLMNMLMDDRDVGVRVPGGSRIFSPPRRPGRLWGPLNLSNWYQGLFPQG